MNQSNATELLKKLGLAESEVQLYLTLLKSGGLSASELTKLTNSKRPTVYYALHQLQDRGLVHKSNVPGTERFQAEKPDKLLTLVTMQERELEQLEKNVRGLIPKLNQVKVPYEGVPAVSFFQGDMAMKQVIMETLYGRSGHIDSIAPADNFFWQIDQTFSSNYVKERAQRGITTRNLWEEPLRPEIIKRSYKGISKIRILPKTMRKHFRTAVFLYDNKVLYISSRKNGYALLVKSKEHHELMKAMYDTLWEISEPHEI